MPHYIKIEILRMLRNKRYLIFVVAFPVGFYLLYANIWGAETDQVTGVRGSVFLMVSMAAYGALAAAVMSTAVPWSQERHSGWLRQLQITPLPSQAIILTKLISSLLLVLPSLALVGLAAVLNQHVSLPPARWAALILAMWVGAIPFAALGLAIGSLLPPETAQSAAMVGVMGLAMLGGVLFPESIMPAALKTVAHATPSYDYASIGWQIVAGQAPHPSAAAGLLAWGAVLVVLALASYRRATVRA